MHVTRDQLQQGTNVGLTATHACSQEKKMAKEEAWAQFVETTLQPALEAFEHTRQARAAIAATKSRIGDATLSHGVPYGQLQHRRGLKTR